MDKVLIIDGFNQMHRANISFPSKNPEEPKEDKPDYQMVFNFFRNLRPLVEQFQPDKIFFVLEGHPKFRYDIFPEYKANRRMVKTASKQESADKFDIQKDIIINLIKHFPITTVVADDYECDDVISTLVKNMPDEDITILSGDTDFIQLLQLGLKNIKIYNPISKKFYEDPGVFYVAMKCLRGDSSDNIPGFKGIGEKTARKMLEDPAKFAEFMSTEENRANFNIYKSLIEFRDVPYDELIIEEGILDWNVVKELFSKMEFESIVNDRSWEKFTKTFECVKY